MFCPFGQLLRAYDSRRHPPRRLCITCRNLLVYRILVSLYPAHQESLILTTGRPDQSHITLKYVLSFRLPQFEISHHHLVLDVTLSGIRASASLALLLFVRLLYIKVLHYLTRTMKRVYAPHMRRVCFVHLL